jgi:hypothetical protein
MKVIFLDIDGVLNSIRSGIGLTGFEGDDKQHGLDPTSVGLLKELCRISGAVIVISSTWRKGRTYDWFIEMFKNFDWIDAPVIDVTPVVSDGFRGEEVKRWLYAHPEVTDHIILDDSRDFFKNQPWIYCEPVNGFGIREFVQALKILAPEHETTLDLTKEVAFYDTVTPGRMPRTVLV